MATRRGYLGRLQENRLNGLLTDMIFRPLARQDIWNVLLLPIRIAYSRTSPQ